MCSIYLTTSQFAGRSKMVNNLFVVGLDDFHLSQLRSLRCAHEYRFHPLMSYKEIKCGENFPVGELLQQATRTLDNFKGSIDGVVGFWDFPVSTVLPIIQQKFDLTGPSLISVLKCEHKYWSRLEQDEVISDMIPLFQKINPFAADAVEQLEIGYPFWLKPVKSVLSHLGFLIRDANEFKMNLKIIRKHIGRYAEPFNFIMDHAELPTEIEEVDGYYCIAESLISKGWQCTLEGYVYQGDVNVYGIIDSFREGPNQSSFSRYQYPSQLPAGVQHRMIEATEKFLTHVGYDNSPFNIEFYWDEENDSIHLLEINTRISKSHCLLFKMVDGEYHHDVMINVALNREPSFSHRLGRYATAAKFMVRRFNNGRVLAVPDKRDIDRVCECFPESQIVIHVHENMYLSELKDQDSYSFGIADIFMGANTHQELIENYRNALSMLPFTIEERKDQI